MLLEINIGEMHDPVQEWKICAWKQVILHQPPTSHRQEDHVGEILPHVYFRVHNTFITSDAEEWEKKSH